MESLKVYKKGKLSILVYKNKYYKIETTLLKYLSFSELLKATQTHHEKIN